MPPAAFAEGLKLELPGLEDSKIIQLYNQAILKDPKIEKMDPVQLGAQTAQTVKAIREATQGQQAQPSAEVPAAQFAQLNTQLKNPLAGTDMMKRNPANPEAEWLNQFDPEQIARARKEYDRVRDETLDMRNVGNYLAAGGRADSVEQNRKHWEAIDKLNQERTFGDLAKKQEAGTKGSALAKETQDRAQQSGVYEGTQKAKSQEIEGKQIELQAKRRMEDPSSAISQFARASAIRQWQAVNNNQFPDKATLAQFDKMNFFDLAPIAEPNLVKMWKEISSGRTAEAGADIDVAVRNEMVKGGTQPGMTMRPGTQSTPSPATPGAAPTGPTPEQIKAAGLNPEVAAAVQRGMQNPKVQQAASATTQSLRAGIPSDTSQVAPPTPLQLSGPLADRWKNFGTISAAGGRVNIPPDPRTVRGAETEATEAAAASQRSKVFEANVAPDIRRIRSIMDKTDPGKLTEAVAKWLPGNSQQELVNMLNAANAAYPGVLQSGVDSNTAAAISRGGFTGGLIASMTGPQIQRMLDLIEEKAGLDKSIAQRTLRSQDAGAIPGRSNIEAPMPSTKPIDQNAGKVMMRQGNRTIAVPADRVKEAEADGFKRF